MDLLRYMPSRQWSLTKWVVSLIINVATAHCVLAANPIAGFDYKEGELLYVWSISGLNLREQPSLNSPVIKKLNYGDSVTVLRQPQKPVPYSLEFFSYKDTSSTFTQIAGERPRVILNGKWIRVKAGQEEGYVFNKLLLDMIPRKEKEVFQPFYFIHAFDLTRKLKKKENHTSKECGGTAHTTIYQTFTSSQNNVVVKTEDSNGDQCTSGELLEISIPGFSFEKAFVLFNTVIPALPEHGFYYKPSHLFEYLIDEVGNTARLKKTKDGILFRMTAGRN